MTIVSYFITMSIYFVDIIERKNFAEPKRLPHYSDVPQRCLFAEKKFYKKIKLPLTMLLIRIGDLKWIIGLFSQQDAGHGRLWKRRCL